MSYNNILEILYQLGGCVPHCAPNILAPRLIVLCPVMLLAHKLPNVKQPATEQKQKTEEPGNTVSYIALGTKVKRIV